MTKPQENTWFDTCLTTLGEAHDKSVYGAIERLVLAGEQVGFTDHDLIRMLRAGMTLESVLDLIEVRMTSARIDSDSRLPENGAVRRDLRGALRGIAFVLSGSGHRCPVDYSESLVGKPHSRHNVWRKLKLILRSLGLQPGGLHAFRHGRVSILQANGMPGDLQLEQVDTRT